MRSLRRQLSKGEILEDHLEAIGIYLDVSPDYLTGEVGLKRNGEIPTNENYRHFKKFIEQSEKNNIYEATKVFLNSQFVNIEDYSANQIFDLSLSILRVVRKFVENNRTTDASLPENTHKKER